MHRSRFASILILLSLLLVTPAFATHYYVATTGSDANAGTLAAPFLTIQHGVDQLDAGDNLYVRGGTYDEAVTIWDKAGTSSYPIYITTYNGEAVAIDGTGQTENGVVVIGDSSYVRFDGFEVKNGPNGGIFIYDANNIKVRWNNVHHMGSGGINAKTASASPFGTAHHLVIHGNSVHHNMLDNSDRDENSVWLQGVSAVRCDYVEITGNNVYENYGEGIDYIGSDHGTIRDNSIWDNFSVNLYLDNAQYTTVDRNWIVTGWAPNHTNYYRNGNPAGGIGVANEYYTEQNPATDLTITNNIVVRCHTGFAYRNSEYGGGLHNTLVANNTFSESVYLNLSIQNGTNNTNIHTTTTIKNNIFYAKTGTSYASAPTTGFTYQTNCWFNGTANTHKSGTGDVLSDPLFVDAGGSDQEDYMLTSSSPCKNTGTATAAVTEDYFGTARSGRGTAIDIGAHEY
ncbi:MAG TPA: right-handed parallel beta-helix repeat-containing protein [Thermoanaerobaculia bacterium]